MKKSRIVLIQAIISLVPILYYLAIWKNLPERIPVHYDSNFVANSYGSKSMILAIILFTFALSFGASLLIINLNKLDPKRRYSNNNSLMIKISWAVILFFAVISGFIVYLTGNNTKPIAGSFSPKYIFALFPILFVALGNFMNNIKPNYFVGIRTPWTLEDEDNWRKTHHLSAKIWFYGGILMFILITFLPLDYASDILLLSVIPFAVIPILYSYYIFRQKHPSK